jgi:hypothetical protein
VRAAIHAAGVRWFAATTLGAWLFARVLQLATRCGTPA